MFDCCSVFELIVKCFSVLCCTLYSQHDIMTWIHATWKHMRIMYTSDLYMTCIVFAQLRHSLGSCEYHQQEQNRHIYTSTLSHVNKGAQFQLVVIYTTQYMSPLHPCILDDPLE